MPNRAKSIHVRLEPDADRWLRDTAEERCVSVQYLLGRAVELLRTTIPDAP